MAVLSMILKEDFDLTTYFNELLKKNKAQCQKSTFWFQTPDNPGKTENDTPIETRLLRKLLKRKETEKLNAQGDIGSLIKNLERFDWIHTLLTEVERQAIEGFLVDDL